MANLSVKCEFKVEVAPSIGHIEEILTKYVEALWEIVSISASAEYDPAAPSQVGARAILVFKRVVYAPPGSK